MFFMLLLLSRLLCITQFVHPCAHTHTHTQALVLHLLCERAAGRDSFWAPYIAVLGDQATHPLLWGPEQQEQLVGSAMLRTLQTRLQQVQEVRW